MSLDPEDRPADCLDPAACRARGAGLCRRCAGVRSMSRMRLDPEADARRLAKIAESSRRPDRREHSRALARAMNGDPETARKIRANARHQAAVLAGGRRLAALDGVELDPDTAAEVVRLQTARGLTRTEALAAVAHRRARRAERPPGWWPFAPLERGAYGVIMADPPWTFNTRGEPARAAVPYRTMTLKDVMDLPVGDLAADDCWLWLWGLTEMVPHALAVLEGWGFNLVTSGTWVKTRESGALSFGRGYVLRNSEEPYYLARRGRPRTHSRSERNTIIAPLREHSRKPEEAYAKALRLFGPARRADLFTRETRPGWEAWGDEATKFDAP